MRAVDGVQQERCPKPGPGSDPEYEPESGAGGWRRRRACRRRLRAWPSSSAQQHGQSAPFVVPQLGSCASSGRAWRLWAARHSQEEAGPLGAQPLPRVLERAVTKAADVTAFDRSGADRHEVGGSRTLARTPTPTLTLTPTPIS
eukprot:scaffold63814_cov63-Phaeocystis_antarctica.AAC.2